MICWKCGKENNFTQVFRNTECEVCGADLHCCRQCEFYSAESHFNCRETVPEPVADKEKANFCDFFRAKKDGVKASSDKADAARSAAAALFGNAEPVSDNSVDSAKNAFNSLFGN